MQKTRISIAALLLITMSLLLTACGASQVGAVTEDTTEHADDEHMDGEHGDQMDPEHAESMAEHEHAEVPEGFASFTNPFAGDEGAVSAGQDIFMTNCLACHGEEGKGDGPAAEGLTPKPANLSDSGMMSMLSDAYLYWRVSKGGAVEPFNSAMPAWESTLTEEQRWQVISYVRSLSGEGHMNDDDHDPHMDDEHMGGDEHSD